MYVAAITGRRSHGGALSQAPGCHDPSHEPTQQLSDPLPSPIIPSLDHLEGHDGPGTPRGPLSQQGTGDELPFELTCLECGLGEVCRYLARETDALQVG